MQNSNFLLPSRLTLVGGKGGVGKTTTAAALSVRLADEGREVLVVSTDPAHSLADALGVPVGPDPTPVPGLSRLRALELDAELERSRFLESHRGALLSLLERGTYLDDADAAGFVDLTVPGVDELAALFRLRALLSSGGSYLVVDTAPTGHTLRLLELPEIARGWLQALQAMDEKHRAVRGALVGDYESDEVSDLLSEIDAELAQLSALLRDAERTRFLLVTGREPVVLAETLRYQEELAGRGIGIAGLVVNRSTGSAKPDAAGVPMTFVPGLDRDPVGLEGLREFAGYLFGDTLRPTPAADTVRETVGVGAPFDPPPDRVLYLVGGKGGVGKSTAAAALALRLARGGRRVLLLSVDPAGSLGDVLQMEVGDEPRTPEGMPGLWVRQLDPGAVWEAFRSSYREETERIFESLLSGGLSGSPDQQVVQRLVDLAPPGIDELAALVEVVDLVEDRRYDALVLDSAPTGHFLRLLELPATALEWTHQVMRLLLKYREVVPPGELAERLLQLARSLRNLLERLRDPQWTWPLIVALPEALSVPETRRLLYRLGELGIEPGAVLVNRLLRNGEVHPPRRFVLGQLAELAAEAKLVGAPEADAGPRGIEALVAFASGWMELSSHTQG